MADESRGATTPGKPGVRRDEHAVQLSAFPKSLALLLPGRWWKHRRVRLMWVNGCVQSAVTPATVWCRRLRRVRRAKLAIGKDGPRLVRAASRLSQVPSLGKFASWSAARVATRSVHRESTTSSDFLGSDMFEAAGAAEILRDFHGASSGAFRVALRNQTARSAFRKVSGVSCLAGPVGITSWRQRLDRGPAGPRISRAFPDCGPEVVAPMLLLVCRRRRRVTAGGVGASNR